MRTSLLHELHHARHLTDQLFAVVRPDSLYQRPIPERHRLIFYLGHLEAFDWNLLGQYALDLPAFHPSWDRLFAFGIDPAAGNLPDDQPSDWPAVAEVEQYNRSTRERLDGGLSAIPEELLEAAIEHRLMHAETLAYLFHQLPYDCKQPQPAPDVPLSKPPQARMLEIPPGRAELGLAPGRDFGWDNEFQAHAVDVPAFAISRYKITNGEYLEFVRGGADPPFFWVQRNGHWFYRGMFAETPLPLDAPVYVTQCQAAAYARWRGLALPSEAQFQRASDGRAPSSNCDFRYWDPVPVNVDDNGVSAPAQLTGNGWEWTSTVFAPFPGFQPFPFYTNYSEPFFDGQHYVLKGGSPRTAARLLRPSFRNWFRPSYPYIYATFRLVEC